MIIKTQKVFKCESCGKKMFRQKSMENHEQFCLANIENHPACFNCKFLSDQRTYTREDPMERKNYPFFCIKKDIPMHNKKSEILNREFIKILETELMPKSCKECVKECRVEPTDHELFFRGDEND